MTQEDSRQFCGHICKSEEKTRELFEQLVIEMYATDAYETESRRLFEQRTIPFSPISSKDIDNAVDENKFNINKYPIIRDVTKLKAHNYLWEDRGHGRFLWVVEVDTDHKFQFIVDESFLGKFEKNCITYDGQIIYHL